MIWLFLIAIALLAIIGLIAYVVSRRHPQPVPEKEIPSDCCGEHEACERDTLLLKTNQIIYFDDEELDALRGIAPDDYSAEEVKMFEDVFFTMRESDVAGWLRSLQLRGIELPPDIKEQALLIVRERRHLL